MKVDRSVVETIAELAQLSFSEQDSQEYIESMTRILGLVEEMQSISTEDVEPMANPLDATQRLRTDEIIQLGNRDELQAIAPETQDGLYLVPKVVD